MTKEKTCLRPDEYIDKNGELRRRRGSVPRCGCCGGPATVLMKIGYYRDDWMILECDTCVDPVCSGCSDTDEDTGECACVDCLQTAAVRRLK